MARVPKLQINNLRNSTCRLGNIPPQNHSQKSCIQMSILKIVHFSITALIVLVSRQSMAGDLIRFPADYANGIRYTVIDRGNIHEEIYTSPTSIETAKKTGSLPYGTVITMVDSRDGKLFRYVVMEKRQGWGTQYPPSIRNGEWEYQTFTPDRSPIRSEDLGRCMSCHKSRENSDYVQTLDQLRAAPVPANHER